MGLIGTRIDLGDECGGGHWVWYSFFWRGRKMSGKTCGFRCDSYNWTCPRVSKRTACYVSAALWARRYTLMGFCEARQHWVCTNFEVFAHLEDFCWRFVGRHEELGIFGILTSKSCRLFSRGPKILGSVQHDQCNWIGRTNSACSNYRGDWALTGTHCDEKCVIFASFSSMCTSRKRENHF